MEKHTFLDSLPVLIKLKLTNKFSNLIARKNRNISKKHYNYYLSLIKQYRCLGIFTVNNIKFIKIK